MRATAGPTGHLTGPVRPPAPLNITRQPPPGVRPFYRPAILPNLVNLEHWIEFFFSLLQYLLDRFVFNFGNVLFNMKSCFSSNEEGFLKKLDTLNKKEGWSKKVVWLADSGDQCTPLHSSVIFVFTLSQGRASCNAAFRARSRYSARARHQIPLTKLFLPL